MQQAVLTLIFFIYQGFILQFAEYTLLSLDLEFPFPFLLFLFPFPSPLFHFSFFPSYLFIYSFIYLSLLLLLCCISTSSYRSYSWAALSLQGTASEGTEQCRMVLCFHRARTAVLFIHAFIYLFSAMLDNRCKQIDFCCPYNVLSHIRL